jgi:dipeptidyl aminopeptidase/acylaminoacyl peptidase
METPTMLHPYGTTTLTLTLATALSLGLGACNRRDSATDRALADSAAVYEQQSRMFRKVGETPNLQGPESARYDRDLDVWFVSNINGTPLQKDNNGYISRLRPDGAPYTIKFIEGGKKGVTLNAPKGLAINGDTLWVADIDFARAFSKRTGALIANVSTKGQARFLNGAAVGPDGAVYMTDTGVLFGSQGEVSHPGPDQVFRITRSGATAVLTSPKLEGPNGITWDSQKKRFVIVSFLGKGIYGWKPGDKDVESIGSGPGQQDGVVFLPDGRLLVTSWTDSSLFVLENGQARTVASGIPSPADIDFEPKDSRVAVPLLMENRVELWELP